MKLNKIKKGILGGLVGIVLVGCSTFSIKPTGHIELAKVPNRVDDHIVSGEVMSELDLGLKLSIENGLLREYIPGGILEGLNLTIAGTQRTYMKPPLPNLPEGAFFKPHRQEYDTYLEMNYNHLTFFAFRMCSHPVIDQVEFWVTDKDTHARYLINHDSLTKIGFRWEF